jgi:adenylate cyclase
MKKRSKAGGEPIKGRRRKTPGPKRRNAPEAVPRSTSSPTTEKKTEVARLTRENAGLLSELRECLQQRTATAEVLSVISRSTFDLAKVLNTVLELGARLSKADKGVILRAGGNASYYAAATYRHTPDFIESQKRILFAPGRNGVVGRVLLEGKSVQIADVFDDPEYAYREFARRGAFRTILGVPHVREGSPIGLFVLHRAAVRPFTYKQIELVENFAAQAVIAIENARLLNELRQRTADLSQRTTELTEALEQQTATAEVLRVISSSPSDLHPVFASMLEKAVTICDAKFGNIYRWDGDIIKLVAAHNTPQAFAEYRHSSPQRADAENSIYSPMRKTKTPIHVIDAAIDQRYAQKRHPVWVAGVELGGVRTFLAVPMLKEDELIGSFSVYRQEVRPFTDKQIEVVQSFASQAVIAIENARLLGELRERSDQLAAQSQELSKLNQQLEERVADQVGEIERMGRLRRFLPPQVADLIVASGTEKQLESHRREITALFCDLRGFTGFTESADAEDVMALLRDYHAAIGEIIIKYNGTLERYAGDGVMVVFNDPVSVENPALQAVLMALEVREAIGALTETWRRLGHEIGFGIGIAHGFATLGTIGFEGRFDYAAIGTVSNVASRLCDQAKPGQILISPRVLMKVESAVKVEPVGEFELKGIRRPLAAYNVIAAV